MAASDLQWFYAPVQHAEFVAVHSAAYDENGTLVSVEPKAQTLDDISREHLVSFLSHVMNGVVNRAVISPAEFAAKVSKV